MDARRKISTLGAAAVLAIALGTGGYALASTPSQATADTYTGPVAESVAPPAQDDAAAQSIYDQQIAQAKAEAEAAAAAQAAADAAAAEAAAEAAKATAPKRAASYAPGQAPKGTPIPQHLVTDPNAGDYNQMRLEDPGFFCAAKSGSTINGVPVCD